jgi:hypothetical protein
MNAQRKKAAIKKFAPLLEKQTIEEVEKVIIADEKEYTTEEVVEIVEALKADSTDSSDDDDHEKGGNINAKSGDDEVIKADSQVFYEEWKVEKSANGIEKLKMLRPRVVITEFEAETLNVGVREGDNTYATMYFLPGEN